MARSTEHQWGVSLMQVIYAHDLADAHEQGLDLLTRMGREQPSRDGDVLTMSEPVTTIYNEPTQRVLFSAVRDANPFFHLFESMWMLAGWRDGRWLDRYVRNFSARFAEDDGDIWGAYGHRWRQHFDVGGGSDIAGSDGKDQIQAAVSLLRENHNSRQVVISMWDPTMDLGTVARDRPCNTHIYLRIRKPIISSDIEILDMTVLCRSNDAIMGAYGANAVHMSVLQEYLAAMIGVRVGRYWQVSNDFHAYKRDLVRYQNMIWHDPTMDERPYDSGLVHPSPLFSGSLETLDSELAQWMKNPSAGIDNNQNPQLFDGLLIPMSRAHDAYKNKDLDGVARHLGGIEHTDWQRAAHQWIARRIR